MKQLHVKLASVSYKGKVGSQWDFTISVGGEALRLKPRIKNGQNKKINKTAYLKDANGGTESLSIFVLAIERDKYIDSGVGSGQFVIVPDSTEQEYTITVQITEDRGPNSKQKNPAMGTLQFNFVYEPSEDDPDCMDQGPIPATVNDAESLTLAQIRKEEKENNKKYLGLTLITPADVYIEGCLYKAGSDWKLRPTLGQVNIRWGVNTSRFNEIALGQNVTCKNIKDAISDVAYRISTIDQSILFSAKTPAGFSYGFTTPPSNRKIWYARDPIVQHELVHVGERKALAEQTWLEIYDAMNAHILGSVDKLSEKAAEQEAKKYIKEQCIAWLKLFAIDLPHRPAYLAEANAAQLIFVQLANYATANKCKL